MKRFVIGDIHGAYQALLQVLNISGFNKEKDLLISLGDVCDGFPETYQCVEELLSIDNFVLVQGNHDLWFRQYLVGSMDGYSSHIDKDIWLRQGGKNTLLSYSRALDLGHAYPFKEEIPKDHKWFFHSAKWYYEIDNKLFVHAGYIPGFKMEEQNRDVLIWDRDFAHKIANIYNPDNIEFDMVFIGHTTTLSWKTTKPIITPKACNIDTGGGWGGKLTIMDIDTLEYWQSDNVEDLYPGVHPRG